jgi:hypothetical protein
MDQKLYFQHDAQRVDDFLDPGHPYYGKLAVFNNRFNDNYSVVNVITPAWDMYKWRYETNNETYLPENYDITIMHPDTFPMWSTGLSSTQFLPNGNTLITVGRFGYTFELSPDNEIVWEYRTPLIGGNPATQGDSLSINNNLTFRMKRYPSAFSGFEGKDLSNKGWIELNPDTSFCDRLVPTFELMNEEAFKIYPNPTSGNITIEWDGMMYANIEVFNIMGQRTALFTNCSGSRKFIDTALWQEGIYFVSINTGSSRYSRKVILQR